MYSPFISPLPLARWYIQQVVEPGDCVLDCTAGNGHDTVFLADLVGPAGTVYAFDIQQAAIAETERKLKKMGYENRVQCILDSHIHLQKYVTCPIKAAMFNLGYLPGGDHGITTQASDSVTALAQAIHSLVPGGMVTVVGYPGHSQGKKEDQEMTDYVHSLTRQNYAVLIGNFLKAVDDPPKLIAIQKGTFEANKSGVQK